MNQLALSGVQTGIDSSAIVDSIMAVNRIPVNRMEYKEAEWKQKEVALEDLTSRLGGFDFFLAGLKDTSTMSTSRVSSGDSDIVGAEMSGKAVEGAYNIEVNQLASAEREVHNGVASKTGTLGGGTFVYSYNGVQRTITLNADATLEDLVTRINEDSANPGTSASILEHDDGFGNAFHLVLSGQDSGSDYFLGFGAGTLAGFDDTAGNWTETQTAQDSEIKVDGYPSDAGSWITRSSNQLTNVLPGITLNLRKTGAVSISVERSTSGLTEAVKGIIDQYNSYSAAIDKYIGYDADTERGGVFQGDSALRILEGKLRSPFTGFVSGFVSGEDSYTQPADIGIEIDKTGQLTLNEEKFNEAIETDFKGLLKFIGAAKVGVVADPDYFEYIGGTSNTEAGAYEVKADFDGAGNITAGWMRVEGETEWRTANVEGSTIVGRIEGPEDDMRVSVTWDGASASQETQVKLQEGFATSLSNTIEDIQHHTTGLLTIKAGRVEESLLGIEKKIDQMERRLVSTRDRLLLKYARFEETMARLDSQSGLFEAMFSALDANSSKND